MNKGFFLKLILYCLPFAAYFAFTLGPATYIGEFMSLAAIASLQMSDHPLLYGRAYQGNDFAFKLIATRLRKPAVLVLGSSRVMQFRSQFFNPGSAYNAGGTTQSIYEVREFITNLAGDALPKVLIIGLDQRWFNPGFEFQRVEQNTVDDMFNPKRALDISWKVLGDIQSGKILLETVFRRTEPVHGAAAVGFRAVMQGNGYRNDGSYQYGSIILNPPSTSERLAEAFERLRSGAASDHFAGADELARSSVDELRRLLQDCKARGIFVIGFSPPFAPSIYSEMMAEGTHTYIPQMAAEFSQLFPEYGFAYFDFSNAALLNAADDDMIDGFHASELINLRLYIKMLEQLPEVLSTYSALDFLRLTAQAPQPNRFEVFPNSPGPISKHSGN